MAGYLIVLNSWTTLWILQEKAVSSVALKNHDKLIYRFKQELCKFTLNYITGYDSYFFSWQPSLIQRVYKTIVDKTVSLITQ